MCKSSLNTNYNENAKMRMGKATEVALPILILSLYCRYETRLAYSTATITLEALTTA